jgi:hypothetical protein
VVDDGDILRVELDLDRPASCTLRRSESGELVYESASPARHHAFPVRTAQRHTLALG